MEAQQAPITVEIEIYALPARVWKALTDPEEIKEYMMGTKTESDWKPGSSITWSGEWQGKSYVDKGEIQACDENKTLQYTHFSPLEGKEDKPENYRIITITLSEADDVTTLKLTQDGAGSEKDREQATQNWQGMMSGLKKLVEGKG